MTVKVVIDIPSLYKKIEVLSKDYVPAKKDASMDFKKEDSTVRDIKLLLKLLAQNVRLQDVSVWKQQGIEFMSMKDYDRCYIRISKKKSTKELGRGFFGSVYNVVSDPCIKHVPKGVKRVAVKLETIGSAHEYEPNQEPVRVAEVIQIYKKAHALGIAPELYTCFVTKNSSEEITIVKVSEIVEGTSWSSVDWSSGIDKQAALADLRSKVFKMNKAGIIHHDLHSGNVMVRPDGTVCILDFDRAKFVKNEELNRLGEFNASIGFSWEPKGLASKEGVDFLYNALLEDGSIVLGSKVAAGTVKSSRMGKKSSKLTTKLNKTKKRSRGTI